MGYSSSQKTTIAEFVGITNVKSSVAAKCLKEHDWSLSAAIDEFFQNNNQSSSSRSSASSLNKIFDQYRDDPDDSPHSIGINGAMKYLNDIKVNLDEVACLAIAELLQSPSLGEFTREEFIEGWRTVGCDTIAKQISYAACLRKQITTDPLYFRRVYRHTFVLCRMAGQRNLSLDIATEQWRLFFTCDHGGVRWQTGSVPWIDWWIEFMETRHKRPINKDLWEQTEVLMRKTMEDETMGWWSADAAWPGAVDEFVAFVTEKTK